MARNSTASDAQLADALAKLARAERALLGAGWIDNGGAEWKPPLGQRAGTALDPTTARCVDALREITQQLEARDPHIGLVAFSDASEAGEPGYAVRTLTARLVAGAFPK